MSNSAQDKLKHLNDLREQSLAGGGPERIAKIHDKGRLTSRELFRLVDSLRCLSRTPRTKLKEEGLIFS